MDGILLNYFGRIVRRAIFDDDDLISLSRLALLEQAFQTSPNG